MPSYSGWANTTWSAPGVSTVFGEQVLNVVMYSSVDAGVTWTARANFVSDILLTTQILASDWLFNYHIYYDGTSLTVAWSGTFSASGIYGIVISDPSIHQTMWFKLVNLDIFGFLLHPYTDIFGDMFYVIIWVAIIGAYYIWSGKMSIVLFLLIMLGSAGGIVFVFLPASANILAWALMTVGIGVILFRLFR